MTLLNTLVAALNAGHPVSFDYDDKPRTVEIHAIGHSTKDSSLIMRGFQIDGESSRPLPIWALFSIDKITNLTVLQILDSQAPRPGYKTDDKAMDIIISQLPQAA